MLKTSKASEIADAVRATYRGQSVLEPEVTQKMMEKLRHPKKEQPHEQLTAREMEVLLLIALKENRIRKLRMNCLLL